MDDSILLNFIKNFGLNTRRDDQLDTMWKVAEEEDRVDADASQAEKRTKKNMDAPLSKVAPVPLCSPPSLVAPKAISAMYHVSRRGKPKKQQPSCTIELLR